MIAGKVRPFKPLEELLKKNGQGLEGPYSSYVYFIGAFDWKTGFLEAIKMGKSNNPPSRLKEVANCNTAQINAIGVIRDAIPRSGL